MYDTGDSPSRDYSGVSQCAAAEAALRSCCASKASRSSVFPIFLRAAKSSARLADGLRVALLFLAASGRGDITLLPRLGCLAVLGIFLLSVRHRHYSSSINM